MVPAKLFVLCFGLANLLAAVCFGQQATAPEHAMFAATSHALWLRPDGKVWGAGEANDGGRGDSQPPEYRTQFLPIAKLPPVRQIAAADNESAALADDGTVWVWGMFDYIEPYDQAKAIPGLTQVRQIAMGSDFLVALRHNGTIAVAGSDRNGLRGKQLDSAQPTPFSEIAVGDDNIAVGATLETALVVKRNGTVWGWGSRFGSLLGRSSNWSFLNRESDPTPVPIQIVGLKDIVDVEGGHRHALALTRNGDVYAWGDNEDGQLGVPRVSGFAETYYQYPSKVVGLPKIVQVSAGYDFSMALDEKGNVWTWGSNTYGCLGVSEEFDEGRVKPERISGLPPVKSVHAGDYHAFAVLKDGRVAGWGRNTEVGTMISTTVKTEFVPPTIFAAP